MAGTPTTHPPILRDPSLQAELTRTGVVVTRLFSDPEISELARIVEGLEADADHENVHLKTPFHLSAFHNDSAWKQRVYDEIHACTESVIDKLLVDYEPLVINIHDKPPGPDTALAIHQNPSFVEEPAHKSVTVWIPLIDVRRSNGTLGVLRGSHGVFDDMRAANMPDVFEEVADKLTSQYFDPLELTRGEAVVLEDSVIHWSYPNLSDHVRLAVQLIMVPRKPHHIYYYYNTSGDQPRLDLYTVDKDFFFKFNCKAEPQGLPFIKSIPFAYRQYSEADLLERVGRNRPDAPASVE
jgi:Phytanoyl-CoA dioxygenase (PhyH)